MNETKTRRNNTPIKVYCLEEEKELIREKAEQAGMSMARYLREVGQGYQIHGIVDYERVRELAKINGDLGRLGGLLKLWLTNDERTAEFGEATIRAVLDKIMSTQDEMSDLMMQVVKPKSS